MITDKSNDNDFDKYDLDEIEKTIPEINEKRRYWFFRTEGGLYYETFRMNNVIAYGQEDINYSIIKAATDAEKNGVQKAQEYLVNYIKANYTKEQVAKPGQLASQLLRFKNEMKKGDIVIIPSHSSEKISIGVIEDNITYTQTDHHYGEWTECPYQKRRKVKWIKELALWSLPGEFWGMKYSQQTINNVDYIQDILDRDLDGFFKQGNEFHFVLDIQTQHPIPFDEWAGFNYSLDVIYKDVLSELGVDATKYPLSVKIEANSPGAVEIISYAFGAGFVIGVILVAFAGGEVDSKFNITKKGFSGALKFRTQGLIKTIMNYKSQKTFTDILRKSTEKLEIKTPEELNKLLQGGIINSLEENIQIKQLPKNQRKQIKGKQGEEEK